MSLGLFVIMGVPSCRAGAGYCLLGMDCTLDEDFLPDDQGGHCDGLRSAFTPSAHFICCRYNAANRTISPETVPLSTPISMGQDITDNSLGLFSDYSNTDTVGTHSEDYGASNFPSAESSEGNFVQNAEMSIGGVSDIQNDNSAPTEMNIETNQASWPLLSSNISLHTAGNSATTTKMDYDISNHHSSDTVTYEEVLVTEGAGFSTQDDASQSTSYTAEMSTDVRTATTKIFMNTDVLRFEHSDETVSTDSESEEQTTETSVTQFPAHIQDQSSGEYSVVKSAGNTGDRIHSNSNSKSSVKNKPIKARAESDRMSLTVLTDQGIMKAYPSVVRAETEILVHENKTSHRNDEIQNRGVTAKETVAQVRVYKTELSNGDERLTTNDVMEMKTVSHGDTTMGFDPSVTVSEIGAAEDLSSDTDNMAVTLLYSVSDNTITSLTPLDQGSVETTTNMEIKSGEDPVKLYGDSKVLKDYDYNSFVNTNQFSGSQTEPSTLDSSTEFASSLLLTATDTTISTTQNSDVSKDEIIDNVLSELMSTDYKQFPGKDLIAVTESNGQFSLMQSLYEDNAGADSKTASFDPDRIDILFQPSKTESEILKNTVKGPEIINEIPVTITTELPLHGKMTSMYKETITSSSKNHDTKTRSKPLHKESNKIDIVTALRNEDRAESVMPKTTEVTSFEMKSTNKEELTTESFESPELGLYETTVYQRPDTLETKGISVQSTQLSTSETITEHVKVLVTEQLNEITTKSLPPNVEMSEKQQEIDKTEGSDVSYNTEPAGGLQLRSGTEIESQNAVFVESDSNSGDVTEFISTTPTVFGSEMSVTSEGTTVLPVVFKTIDSSSPAVPVQSSSPSSTPESSNPSIRVHSSILSNSIFPADGVTTQQTNEPSSLCSIETFEKFQGTKCWLVQFLTPYSSNSSICVGSYLDSNTIVTSANCVSRLEESRLFSTLYYSCPTSYQVCS
jgi:hypothetical protein